MKSIICINNIYEKFHYRQSEFTYGKSYLVLEELDRHYLVKDDFSNLTWIFKNKEEINFTLDTSKLIRKLKLNKIKNGLEINKDNY